MRGGVVKRTNSALERGGRYLRRMPVVRRKKSHYLLDRRFQLKWTGYLVVVVLLVMTSLGIVIARIAGRASDTAAIAVEQAERAYKESQANNTLVKQSVALVAPDNATLATVLEESLGEEDGKSAKNLADVRAQRMAIDTDRRNLKLTLGGTAVVLLCLLFAMGIVITHRIVGPVHKMKRLLRRVSTGRLVIEERLRRGDELEDLFDTFLQMTYSLRAIQKARLATLDGTLKRAENSDTPDDVVDGLRALRAQMVLGIEPRRASVPPPPPV